MPSLRFWHRRPSGTGPALGTLAPGKIPSVDRTLAHQLERIFSLLTQASIRDRDVPKARELLTLIGLYVDLQDALTPLLSPDESAATEKARAIVTEHLPPAPAEPQVHDDGVPVIQVTRLFLEHCLTDLLPPEKVGTVSGIALDNGVIHLDQLLLLAPASASEGHVEPTGASTYRNLLRTEAGGEEVYALFHSHPGSQIPSPSGKDLATHERLESAGYSVIGGIFTEGGYVRFFSHHTHFSVKVLGQGVEVIDAKTFRFPC
jgi:hypothetical protein